MEFEIKYHLATKSLDQPVFYLTLRSHKIRFSASLQNILT
jgi:hypothetical protein